MQRSDTSTGLSARQQELLAMEGRAYNAKWIGGEPVIIRVPSMMRHTLSTEDEQFIAQHARDTQNAKPSPASRGKALLGQDSLIAVTSQ